MSTTTSRLAVLTLDSLATRMRETTTRAMDAVDRDSYTSDEGLRAQLSLLMSIADDSVWACHTDYDDEAGLQALRAAHTAAEKAWRYLGSKAPTLQRTLTQPNAEDNAFVWDRMRGTSRSGAAWCRIQGDTLTWLQVPHLPPGGDPSVIGWWHLEMILGRCTQLAQAARVLRALGLKPRRIEHNGTEALECCGDIITRVAP